ncbi:MAG: DUF3800 domain-containing protein [Bacteroidota bacterium]
MKDKALYIFIDESGNMDFSANGTKYCTLTSLSKIRPFVLSEPLFNLKYDLWEKGLEFEYFHASEDKIDTRTAVFDVFEKNIRKFQIDSVIVEKRKTHPAIQEHDKFYKKVFEFLLGYTLKRFSGLYSQAIIITYEIPVKKRKKEIQKAIKSYISHWSEAEKIPYKIYHYSSKSDMNLHIIDYINWAIFRKWERTDNMNYEKIAKSIVSEFDVFKAGGNFKIRPL